MLLAEKGHLAKRKIERKVAKLLMTSFNSLPFLIIRRLTAHICLHVCMKYKWIFYNFQFSNISFASKGKIAISYFCIGQVKQEKQHCQKHQAQRQLKKYKLCGITLWVCSTVESYTYVC
jgi:hypothetical protein